MPEKSECVPTKSISILQERALDLIGSRSDGVFQSDLRRLLGIDSSKCSKVVTRMQSSGLIYREKVPASSTYLIKLIHASSAPAFDEEDEAAEVQRSHIESHVGSHMKSNIDSKIGGHIDSFLTEIYLLYMVRGISG